MPFPSAPAHRRSSVAASEASRTLQAPRVDTLTSAHACAPQTPARGHAHLTHASLLAMASKDSSRQSRVKKQRKGNGRKMQMILFQHCSSQQRNYMCLLLFCICQPLCAVADARLGLA